MIYHVEQRPNMIREAIVNLKVKILTRGATIHVPMHQLRLPPMGDHSDYPTQLVQLGSVEAPQIQLEHLAEISLMISMEMTIIHRKVRNVMGDPKKRKSRPTPFQNC